MAVGHVVLIAWFGASGAFLLFWSFWFRRRMKQSSDSNMETSVTSKRSKCSTSETRVSDHRVDEHACRPIGHMVSCFPDRRSAPRQGSIVPAAAGILQMHSWVQPQASLDGLEGFSHLWLTWIFHKNTEARKPKRRQNDPQMALKAKVKVPRLYGRKTGLFATRTPHRPNKLGLTLARIVRVDKAAGRIFLSGVDLIDGTPVVDIKPFVQYSDSPEEGRDVVMPAWVQAPAALNSVSWTPSALDQLRSCHTLTSADMFASREQLQSAIEQTISCEVPGRAAFLRRDPQLEGKVRRRTRQATNSSCDNSDTPEYATRKEQRAFTVDPCKVFGLDIHNVRVEYRVRGETRTQNRRTGPGPSLGSSTDTERDIEIIAVAVR